MPPAAGTAPGTGTTAAPGAGTGTTAAPGMGTGTDMNRGAATPGAAGTNAAPRDSSPPTTTTPAAGANSFTEGQARRRIEDAGYTDVQELKKDDKGVWRGRAMRNGAQTDVGLDFQGKVVTGNAPAQ
ncbi:hypothetical protein EBE87_05980 [Pseudoroseomonas wenyumeiae]|uniref:Uncharacterized protein n=2 Tax=Teichococcus wenyumeiae TaxID=2478470 RepID=A0A3A9JAS9_9PROT|nr:hypothetical protein D6Z83_27730 [Pseudoroseomonas wenyumeiae]RMI26172.1 hypothetical protein EBE87_05980 [Pseudoroseomonas wenyumeiae]